MDNPIIALPQDMPEKIGGFCGVLAVAVCANVPFAKAWEALRIIKRKDGRWKGSTRNEERVQALTMLGASFRDSGPVRPMALTTWVFRCAKPNVTYLVRTRGHVQVIRNRIVLDQKGSVPIRLYWGRNKRVTQFLEMTEN